MTRRYCTPAEKQALSDKQSGMCALCGEPLGLGPTHADHTTPHALRPERKPDALVHASCHALKTKLDVKRIAKAKRQAKKAPYRLIKKAIRRAKVRKMQGRPFDRKWKRKLDGTVVRRAA